MRRRLFTFASAVSALLFVGVCLLWAFDLPPQRGAVRVTCVLRVGVFGHSTLIYNQTFPYTGSIISMRPSGQLPSDPVAVALNFAGAYYRHSRWRSGFTCWTLTVPTLYPVTATTILPLIWLARVAGTAGRTSRTWGGRAFDLPLALDRRTECGTVPAGKGAT